MEISAKEDSGRKNRGTREQEFTRVLHNNKGRSGIQRSDFVSSIHELIQQLPTPYAKDLHKVKEAREKARIKLLAKKWDLSPMDEAISSLRTSLLTSKIKVISFWEHKLGFLGRNTMSHYSSATGSLNTPQPIPHLRWDQQIVPDLDYNDLDCWNRCEDDNLLNADNIGYRSEEITLNKDSSSDEWDDEEEEEDTSGDFIVSDTEITPQWYFLTIDWL
jgi:hypothetical protein